MNEINEFLNVLIISVVAVLIFCVGWVIIYGTSKRKFRELLSQRIKSLGKDDFSIINETKVGVVCLCTEENSKKYSNAIKVVGKRLNLTDHIQIRMEVPIHSVELYNYDYKAEEWNEKLWNDINVYESLGISEQQYNEYLDLIKECDSVMTDSFYLEIKLVNTDVIALIDKWNKRYKECDQFDIAIRYAFERYNVLNLITNMKPFSDEEVDELIDKIKSRMIELLQN